MSTTIVDAETTVDRYVAVWNETDPVRRRALIADAFVSNGTYVDPMLTGEGHAGIDAMVGAAQQQFIDHCVRLTGPVDSHHDRVRFPWEIVDPNGEATVVGIDFGILAPDGRLQSITGFFDKAPE